MGKRLASYSFLSFLSACFFFVCLQAFAADLPITSSPQHAGSQPTPTSQPSPAASLTPEVNPTSLTSTVEPTVSIASPTPSPTLAPTATPTPTATPIPTIASPAELETLFTKYGSEYTIDKELLKKIAKCESGFNTQADTGTYVGLFQFWSQTWISVRTKMGLDPNPDLRKNAEESIRTAAYMISRGQENAWPNCK